MPSTRCRKVPDTGTSPVDPVERRPGSYRPDGAAERQVSCLCTAGSPLPGRPLAGIGPWPAEHTAYLRTPVGRPRPSERSPRRLVSRGASPAVAARLHRMVGARNGSQCSQPSPDPAQRNQNVSPGKRLPIRSSRTVTDTPEFPDPEAIPGPAQLTTRPPWPHFGRTTTLAIHCAPVKSISAGQRRNRQEKGASLPRAGTAPGGLGARPRGMRSHVLTRHGPCSYECPPAAEQGAYRTNASDNQSRHRQGLGSLRRGGRDRSRGRGRARGGGGRLAKSGEVGAPKAGEVVRPLG